MTTVAKLPHAYLANFYQNKGEDQLKLNKKTNKDKADNINVTPKIKQSTLQHNLEQIKGQPKNESGEP